MAFSHDYILNYQRSTVWSGVNRNVRYDRAGTCVQRIRVFKGREGRQEI